MRRRGGVQQRFVRLPLTSFDLSLDRDAASRGPQSTEDLEPFVSFHDPGLYPQVQQSRSSVELQSTHRIGPALETLSPGASCIMVESDWERSPPHTRKARERSPTISLRLSSQRKADCPQAPVIGRGAPLCVLGGAGG